MARFLRKLTFLKHNAFFTSMKDYVYYNEDKYSLIRTAELLGIKHLCFIVLGPDLEKQASEVGSLSNENVSFSVGMIVGSRKYSNKARSLGAEKVYVHDKGNDIRDIIREDSPDVIFGIERQKRDFMHHRASGLNQISAKSMKDQDVSLGIDLGFLRTTKYRSGVMGRMMQNINLAKKYNLKIECASLAKSWNDMVPPKEVKSLITVLSDEKVASSIFSRK